MNKLNLDKSRWALNAMSRAVKAMHHSSSDAELCQACCEAITVDAAYPLAWIGFALSDEKRNIEIVAKSGRDISYLDGIHITWADEPNGRGVAGTSIRTGKAQTIDNAPLNPALAPWKDRVFNAGFNSAVAIPIIDGAECVGTLLVYAYQPNAFDETAVSLLENLAEVIGFGVGVHRTSSIMLEERRKAMELQDEKLRALQLLNTVSNSSTDAIFAKDLAGRYLLYNREALREIGMSSEEVIGKKDEEVYPAEIAERIRKRDALAISLGRPITYEESLHTVDGERTFLTTKGPLRDVDANIIGTFGISRDITERKKSELVIIESMRQMEAKESAKTRFLAAASHDLRQPLAAANLFVDALKFTDPTPDQHEIIQRLDQAMVNFNGLLDALLNVSKLDAGMIKPDYVPIPVAGVGEWVVQSFASLADEKRLRFKIFFPVKEALYIRGDIGLLKSVLMNLISNAIKYTLQGAILVSARRRGSDVLFQVWDTGIGIRSEHVEHIFDEFYQVNNPQRDRTSGLGLGLAIAKRAISLLGGKIICRSQSGRGSVFEFRLPLSQSREAEILRENAVSPLGNIAQETFVRGKNIVVVEDDSLVAEALSRSMAALGGSVRCFSTAEDALSHSDIGQADFYIADYMLGGTFNGVQFLRQLGPKAGKPVIAVLMTGDTSPSFIREAATCDWPVLHKPASIASLISSLSVQVP